MGFYFPSFLTHLTTNDGKNNIASENLKGNKPTLDKSLSSPAVTAILRSMATAQG